MELTLAQLETIVGGRLRLPANSAAPSELTGDGRVVIDSRQTTPGDVFWAFPGAKVDGADFAADAFERGAAVVVTMRSDVHSDRGWTLHVDHAGEALTRLAQWRREQTSARIVAVTGSVGKTTTRAMIQCVLGSRMTGVGSVGNHNNHIGLPLSLTALRRGHEFGVFEIGASGPDEVARLAALCRPQIGVITKIGEAHLVGFGSVEQVARAKCELLDALPTGGVAIVNGDDPWLRRLTAARENTLWVGRSADNDLVATYVRFREGRLRFAVDRQAFEVPVAGRHYLVAILAAIAVGRAFDISYKHAAMALADFRPPRMRCSVRPVGGATLIDDTYNASPAAMRAALRLLHETPAAGRRVVVCGDMRELGAAAPELHRELGAAVVTQGGADVLVAIGDFAVDVADGAVQAGLAKKQVCAHATVSDAEREVGRLVAPGDVILIKGSRAMALERLVAVLDARFANNIEQRQNI